MQPLLVHEYKDSIIISISYIDGGGDLGDSNPTAKNVFVTDSRNNITYKYRIPSLNPTNQDLNVQGIFNIHISNTFLISTDSVEYLNYSVYITDRSGNISNTITTPEIKVIK